MERDIRAGFEEQMAFDPLMTNPFLKRACGMHDCQRAQRRLWCLDLGKGGAQTWAIRSGNCRQIEVEPPSAIEVLEEGRDVILRTMELAAKYGLRARRIHDARHAATALTAGVRSVYTYDLDDWGIFQSEGLQIMGPPTVTSLLGD